MLHSPQIGEVTTDRETMEGVGLPIARGIKGELGAAMADKAIIPVMIQTILFFLPNHL